MDIKNQVAVYDTCFYCTEHFPLPVYESWEGPLTKHVELDDEEVDIIEAWEEVDFYPVCQQCGSEFDYMRLTEDGEREVYKRRIANGETNMYPDRFEFISAYYVYTLDYNDDEMSYIRYRLTNGKMRYYPGLHASYLKLSENEKLYYHLIEQKWESIRRILTVAKKVWQDINVNK